MKKILIADDQMRIRELVKVTVRIGEYQILEAASGREAIDVALQEQPDLIFLDVMMPAPDSNLDGFEVCRILKADERTQNCKIIMLTALGKDEDKEKGADVGADGYFTKPFSPLEIMSKVEEILG